MAYFGSSSMAFWKQAMASSTWPLSFSATPRLLWAAASFGSSAMAFWKQAMASSTWPLSLSAMPRLMCAPALSGRRATAAVRKRTASSRSGGVTFCSALPRSWLIQKSAGYCSCARRSNRTALAPASTDSSRPARRVQGLGRQLPHVGLRRQFLQSRTPLRHVLLLARRPEPPRPAVLRLGRHDHGLQPVPVRLGDDLRGVAARSIHSSRAASSVSRTRAGRCRMRAATAAGSPSPAGRP